MYEQLLQADPSDLFLHALVTQRASTIKFVNSKGLQSIEKVAADNIDDIPIQSFLLILYYDCFARGFTAKRDEIASKETFEGIYKKTLSCMENLKLLDSTSATVCQIEGRLPINGKRSYLSGPNYVPRVDGFFYDTLWRQDTRLRYHTPFNQQRLQGYSKKRNKSEIGALPIIEE